MDRPLFEKLARVTADIILHQERRQRVKSGFICVTLIDIAFVCMTLSITFYLTGGRSAENEGAEGEGSHVFQQRKEEEVV